MKALLYKDWIVFRWVFLIVPVFLVLQIALLVPRVGWKLEYILGMPTVVLVVTGIFSGIGAQITDMRFQVDRYLQSAPINKALVMLERYLWFWIIGVIASVLISVALHFGGAPTLTVSLVAAGCLFATTFFPTLLTPCIYLLGPEKAFIPLMIIFMILGFGMSIGSNSLSDAGKAQLLAVLAGKINLIAGGLLVLTIALNVGSYFASLAIYRHKVN
ncbi:ABC-2 transporter permease [Mobiluncus mulieris]|uniref:ABC-2 transporter permease n=1 Tax=Mobiluncus mulieris TaxID=2052 RepID=UPI00242D2C7E|nr:ABC-2 transporter permease [Mobiluncus mulieris]